MHIRLNAIGIAAVMALAGAHAGAQTLYEDPFETVCNKTLESMRAESIDNNVTIQTARFYTQETMPVLIDELNEDLRFFLPVIVADEYERAKNRGAWLIFTFIASRDVLNNPDEPAKYGLYFRPLVAVDSTCRVFDPMPYRFEKVPHITKTDMAVNQSLLQRDGTYRSMTPDDALDMYHKSDQELSKVINDFLVEKLRPQLTQPTVRQSNDAQKPR